jgi:hypothetical protein
MIAPAALAGSFRFAGCRTVEQGPLFWFLQIEHVGTVYLDHAPRFC